MKSSGLQTPKSKKAPTPKFQRKSWSFSSFIFLWVAAPLLGAATLTEDFSTAPETREWRTFGDASLFQWNSANQNLEVTWDSSRTNSYFYHPLTNIVAKADDFSLSFDLTLRDYIVGITPGQPYAFPVAIGFLNLEEAMLPNFSRGSGVNSRYGPKNLVEFDFFPAFDVFAPTIAQVIVSTNNVWLYNHENLLDIPPGDVFHIQMTFAAATRALTTVTLRNGVQYGQAQTIQVPTNTFDFRATAISVSSYNDQHADGSILAHGVVDNLTVVTPPPPVQNLRGYFTNNQWRAEFLSRSNWTYVLQQTANFQSWTDASPAINGNGANLILTDASAPTTKAFYRVHATRP